MTSPLTTKVSSPSTRNMSVMAKQTPYGASDDDDAEIVASFDNDADRKEWNKGKEKRTIARPVLFGDRSFINGKLNAPRANVTIGKESTLRGQVLGRKIKIRKEGLISRQDTIVNNSDA